MQDFTEFHHRFPHRQLPGNQDGGSNPSVPDRIEQKRIRKLGASTRPGRTKLGHDAIAVRDQNGFASGRQPDIFAELVFEQFDADRPHAIKVATGSYFVNGRLNSGFARADRPTAGNEPASQIDKDGSEGRPLRTDSRRRR